MRSTPSFKRWQRTRRRTEWGRWRKTGRCCCETRGRWKSSKPNSTRMMTVSESSQKPPEVLLVSWWLYGHILFLKLMNLNRRHHVDMCSITQVEIIAWTYQHLMKLPLLSLPQRTAIKFGNVKIKITLHPWLKTSFPLSRTRCKWLCLCPIKIFISPWIIR